jgi:TRAP-type C4-dicarboxylate transport system permease small subunit
MRRYLDALYDATLWLSALCLVVIAMLVGLQIGGRLVDGALKFLGLPVTGFQILSLAEIAGYMLAAASFLALAGTLKGGAHIRVTMVLSAFGESRRYYLEIMAFAIAAIASAYMTWSLAQFAWYSFVFNEVSYGVVRVQLAYPQAVMALGAAVLTIALIDELAIVITRGRPTFRGAEDAITLGKEG